KDCAGRSKPSGERLTGEESISPPKGHRCCIVAMRTAISQVKGQTGRSSEWLRPLLSPGKCLAEADPAQHRASRRRRKDGRLRRLGHAGELRLPNRGTPCRAP